MQLSIRTTVISCSFHDLGPEAVLTELVLSQTGPAANGLCELDLKCTIVFFYLFAFYRTHLMYLYLMFTYFTRFTVAVVAQE